MMRDLVDIHPHAFKHGLTAKDIRHAWYFAFCWACRCREDGCTDFVLVGPDAAGRAVELVSRLVGERRYIVFHAMRPPTRRTLEELRIQGRR